MQNTDSNPSIDIGRIIRIFLMQSKLIILISMIFFSLGLIIYVASPKIYKIQSLIQVYSNQPSGFGDNFSLDFTLGGSGSDISNTVNLYKTRSNILKIINDMNLNIQSDDKDEVDEAVINKFIASNPEEFNDFYIRFYENTFNIYDDQEELLASSIHYNKDYKNEKFIINVLKPQTSSERLVKFYYKNPLDLIKNLSRKLQVESSIKRNSWYKSDDLITISMLSNDKNEGINIINLANEIFINQNIKGEKEKASKAINFIDQRIDATNELLTFNKEKLKTFREQNKSINVDLEIESIIDSISNLDVNINKLELEIAEAANLYTENNPIYLNLNEKKEALISQKRLIESRIKDLPLAQQQYIDLYRDVEITEELYVELVNKKLTYSILEASTIGNIRVIDNAYNDGIVSPRLFNIVIMTFFGIFISLAYALIRGLYYLPISNPAELRDNNINIPIIGVIPKLKNEEDNSENQRLSTSLESLIINIKSIFDEDIEFNKPNKTILITSPSPSNGKSYISNEVANQLSNLGHKVLLLDCDLKRGKLHKKNNVSTISYESFMNIDETSIEEYKISNSLYLIPRLKNLRDSFKYLYSPSFGNKINDLKTMFDYVIIDTPPLLNVADTSLLMAFADKNFIVIRHDLNTINEAHQLISTSQQVGQSLSGIIYNAFERPSGYYGYYALYGNYDYQYYANKYLYDYGYSEENDD